MNGEVRQKMAVFLYWDYVDALLWHTTKFLGNETTDSTFIGSAFVNEGVFDVPNPENYVNKVEYRETWEIAARARLIREQQGRDTDHLVMASLASYAA